MPARTPVGPKRGKKLKFPPGIVEEATQAFDRQHTPARLCNMALQTDLEEQSQADIPGIPEVMAAITNCQTALTSKIEAV